MTGELSKNGNEVVIGPLSRILSVNWLFLNIFRKELWWWQKNEWELKAKHDHEDFWTTYLLTMKIRLNTNKNNKPITMTAKTHLLAVKKHFLSLKNNYYLLVQILLDPSFCRNFQVSSMGEDPVMFWLFLKIIHTYTFITIMCSAHPNKQYQYRE